MMFRTTCAFLAMLMLVTLSGCDMTGQDDNATADGEQVESEKTPEETLQRDLQIPEIEDDPRQRVAQSRINNPEAPIPPQCYTKTESKFNPCYTCHQTFEDRDRPNYMNDGSLQGDYGFSDLGNTNHWKNLFIDRTEQIAAISDNYILDYIQQDNYSPFITRLKNDPEWEGVVPAIDNLENGEVAFDEQGFAKDGSGWVAFNYKPLPSTFWPTNGNTDDVMLRLPEPFRRNACGSENPGYSRDAYMANLSILEAAIKEKQRITTPPIDESEICEDLDQDGHFTTVTEIKRPGHYVGGASDVEVVPMLYPKGIQFLHTVRYVGTSEHGEISIPPRMKEVRYMKKIRFYDRSQLRTLYGNELQEKLDGNLPRYSDKGDRGLDNGFGWMVLGFIEDQQGELRKQTREEQKFCMGCHTSIGATVDQTFAFPRKVTGASGWGYIDLEGMKDAPSVSGSEGEILTYLRRVGGGNEFRENAEMQARWFNADGSVKTEKVRNADVYELITPSHERALKLNKAYRAIVDEQSFIFGRDATLKPAQNVHDEIDPSSMEPLPYDHHVENYDIRLDWSE